LGNLAHGSATAALEWAQRLAKNRADLDNFLLLAQLWYRDLLLSHFQAPGELYAHQDLLPALSREGAAGTPKTWFANFTALSQAQRQFQANLNPELTLDILGFKLAAPREPS
jgi:hypothetical protein